MIWLTLGVLIWAYSHLMKRVTPDFRARLGDGPGKGVVSLLSFLSIGLMIWGYRQAPVVTLWQPPAALHVLNNVLMLVAVILVNMGYDRGRLRGLMRHPMLTSVVIWAVAHLLVNGDLASLILFGGIGLWAVVDIFAINATEPAWAKPNPGPVQNDLIYLALSLLLFAAFTWVHGWLGYPVLG